MKLRLILLFTIAVSTSSVSVVNGQVLRYERGGIRVQLGRPAIQNRQPTNHIEHHDHVVERHHEDQLRRHQHNAIRRESVFVLPYIDASQYGSYYTREGQHNYMPQALNPHHAFRPTVVTFGSFRHIDDLSNRLEALANEFCLDLHYNYSHNQGYRATYREAYQLFESARYIQAAEHQRDRTEIRRQLVGIDQLIHHIESNVRDWSRQEHQLAGQGGIREKMELLKSTLHHLMNDVGIRPAQRMGEIAPPPPPQPSPLTTAPAPLIP